jgi:DNA-binding XRE family transcriptional regulator
LTQEKLAELVELNTRTIQKMEAGQLNLLLTTILRLQKALRCPWENLWDK